jgi:3-hydroxyisobutyrate dehydrogenase-like beta-hydroxyacid dehydrogenase
MGAGIGGRLRSGGAEVRTSLAGRSGASAARAARAGIAVAEDDAALLAGADFVLSIVPPGEARALAARLAPALAASTRKPAYVDCNAVSPSTTHEVAALVAPTGCAFIDAGIIGAPPGETGPGPKVYASGGAAPRLAVLRGHGIDIRVLDGEIGDASALKMAYAALTKGLTALCASAMLGAMRAGVAPALQAELADSQPAIHGWVTRQVPRMYPKAYRWVAEMEEIAQFLEGMPGAEQIYTGSARLYEQLAEAMESRGAPGNEIDLLEAFLGR